MSCSLALFAAILLTIPPVAAVPSKPLEIHPLAIPDHANIEGILALTGSRFAVAYTTPSGGLANLQVSITDATGNVTHVANVTSSFSPSAGFLPFSWTRFGGGFTVLFQPWIDDGLNRPRQSNQTSLVFFNAAGQEFERHDLANGLRMTSAALAESNGDLLMAGNVYSPPAQQIPAHPSVFRVHRDGSWNQLTQFGESAANPYQDKVGLAVRGRNVVVVWEAAKQTYWARSADAGTTFAPSAAVPFGFNTQSSWAGLGVSLDAAGAARFVTMANLSDQGRTADHLHPMQALLAKVDAEGVLSWRPLNGAVNGSLDPSINNMDAVVATLADHQSAIATLNWPGHGWTGDEVHFFLSPDGGETLDGPFTLAMPAGTLLEDIKGSDSDDGAIVWAGLERGTDAKAHPILILSPAPATPHQSPAMDTAVGVLLLALAILQRGRRTSNLNY
jgi:hypothetical protein